MSLETDSPIRLIQPDRIRLYAVDDLEAWAARGAVTSTSDPRGAVLSAKRQTLPAVTQPGRYAR